LAFIGVIAVQNSGGLLPFTLRILSTNLVNKHECFFLLKRFVTTSKTRFIL